MGTDNETSAPKTSPLPKRQTRSESRIASYVIPSILEPPRADDSEPEESLTGPIAAQDRAASSLAKGPRLLIAAVDSQVWPNVDIRAYTLPGSQAS